MRCVCEEKRVSNERGVSDAQKPLGRTGRGGGGGLISGRVNIESGCWF